MDPTHKTHHQLSKYSQRGLASAVLGNLRSEEERKTSDRVSIALVGMGQVCRKVLFGLDKFCYFLRKWLKGCTIGVVCSLGAIAIKHLLDALIWVGLSGKPGTNRAFEGCLMG